MRIYIDLELLEWLGENVTEKQHHDTLKRIKDGVINICQAEYNEEWTAVLVKDRDDVISISLTNFRGKVFKIFSFYREWKEGIPLGKG